MLHELIETIGHASSYGSGALKALQNDNLPELDLLVREAIQNSSDAAIGMEADSFAVNFTVGEFTPHDLNPLMNSLTEVMNDRFQESSALFMEIRDSKTNGLTGPVRLSSVSQCEDHGNYWKLVFDTGKEQTASDTGEAGGSWGYGKSVYYRVGIGLVIFYSQIKCDSGFEERMVFSLTEHESGNSSMLRKIRKDSIGRAWWGKADDQDSKELLPVTDPNEIQSILDIFNLKRFKDGQTGTAIIIPYVDRNKLLDGIFPDGCGISDDEQKMCSWKDSITEYLELAIQKWYAPKVFNKTLLEISNQKWLAVRINGKPIKTDTMRPFFVLVQELYNTALSCSEGKQYKAERFEDIKTIAIPSQRIEGNKSGYVAYVKIGQDDLSASGSMIKPYTYLRLFSKSALNDPIVMFARTPGMILDYKIDGKWAKGLIKPENDDEFLLVFYVPACTQKLKNDNALGEFAGQSFGEYLRKCEKSDHMDWIDKSSLTIVERIKGQIANKINNDIKSADQIPVEGTTSKLAGKLGRRLLPLKSTKRKGGSGGSGEGGGGTSGNLGIELSPTIYPNYMEIEFKLSFKNLRKAASLGVFVETETGVMDADSWEDNISNEYPLALRKISEANVYATNSGVSQMFSSECNVANPLIKNDYSTIELVMSKSSANVRGFKVTNEITNAVVTGKLIIETSNRTLVCAVKEVRNA